MKKLLCSCVLSLSLVVTSVGHTPANPEQVLELSISRNGMTRITIDKDGIEDIYVFPTEFADNLTHHKGGHIFVVGDGLKGPLYVTVITARGIAQDLKLVPKSKDAELILLSLENKEVHQQEIQDSTTSILKNFIQGFVPMGFYPISVDEVSRGIPGKGTLEAVAEKAYQNERYRLLIFKVKNGTDEQVTLDNRTLWTSKDVASAFDQPQLKPNEEAKFYVIQNR